MAISLKTVIRCSTNACLSSFTQMNRRSLICGVMLVLLLTATQYVEGQDSSPELTAESKNTEHALKILSRATRFIETAPAFVVKGNSGGELMLESGQLVEYGTAFSAIFKRPSQLKLLLTSRDGLSATMILDGDTITVITEAKGLHIYDTAPQPGDVNESLDFMSDQAGSSRELDHFLSHEWTMALKRVRSGVHVGKSAIAGIWCDHLAVRSDTKDGQAWIARGDEPLPWRILITHREEPMQPRFWVQFDEWDFAPEISESTFKFTPPEDAVKFDYFQD